MACDLMDGGGGRVGETNLWVRVWDVGGGGGSKMALNGFRLSPIIAYHRK